MLLFQQSKERDESTQTFPDAYSLIGLGNCCLTKSINIFVNGYCLCKIGPWFHQLVIAFTIHYWKWIGIFCSHPHWGSAQQERESWWNKSLVKQLDFFLTPTTYPSPFLAVCVHFFHLKNLLKYWKKHHLPCISDNIHPFYDATCSLYVCHRSHGISTSSNNTLPNNLFHGFDGCFQRVMQAYPSATLWIHHWDSDEIITLFNASLAISDSWSLHCR